MDFPQCERSLHWREGANLQSCPTGRPNTPVVHKHRTVTEGGLRQYISILLINGVKCQGHGIKAKGPISF